MTNSSRSDRGESKKYPWTAKRVIALAAIILLVCLYLAALVSALFTRPGAARLFRFCLGLTIVVPIFAWVLIFAVGFFTKKHTIASVDLLSSSEEARKEMTEARQKAAEPESHTEK